MTIKTKYSLEQKVRHRLTGFEGHIVGIIWRSKDAILYEVMPSCAQNGDWREEKWISERHIEVVEEKQAAGIRAD